MKNFLILTALAAGLWACSDNKSKQENKYDSGVEYDQHIMSAVTKMQQSLFAVQKGLESTTNADSLLKKYQSSIDSINKTIKEMPAFNENTAFRNAASKLGGFYKKAVGNYYADIAKIYKEVKDTSAATKIIAVIKKIQDEEAQADNDFAKERLVFAKKNGVPVEEVENAATPDTTKAVK